MEKLLLSEDSLQSGSRPMCSVPPRQQADESLRQHAENTEEDDGQKMTLISPDAETDLRRRKPALVRSRTFDPALLLQVQSDSESKCERRKPQSAQSLRTNIQYHKVFKDIGEEEQLRQSYTCALQKDILYQGRLFVSDNWICFHSKVFGKDTKIVIPVASVTIIKKTKTAILVPNALVISTARERHVFVSFLSRDATYKVLMSVCPHLFEKSPGVSQIPSQSLRRHPASLTADFSADLSDLDAPVSQAGQHMDDSSSSDCPESPDFIKTPKFTKRPQACIEVTERNEELDSHTQETSAAVNIPVSSGSVEVMKRLSPVSLSLNSLLVIYVSLVCVLLVSSCVMALKIMSLEERLTSLVSMEIPHKRDEYQSLFAGDTAEIFSVLSASLLKLEKIHRNLQRLMENASEL
ncbi:GRAM domain-containing protein 2B [Puntigrus tetrazona]|uniref:GRAM domain-containing protein 2B n=1 Tax=Puntigrus tetrazona TaxID=1606681 RepID=UPI001C8AAA47|nr:GRAM domain-containing protein 2B [Puntigrus tetrazona]